MSAVHRVPFVAKTLGLAGILVGMSSVPAVRNVFARLLGVLGIHSPGGVWRILAILFALVNIKSSLFVWHIRVFRGILYHLFLQPKSLSPQDLFKPLVTSSWNPLTEMDYNLHKSNSTYFADLDVARAHYVSCLLKESMAKLNRGDMTGVPEEAKAIKQGYIVALGGVMCDFRKEIRAFERYDVWTRLLAWDEKWLYVMSHVVKKGSKRPTANTLQPFESHSSRKAESADDKRDLSKIVFASSLAKYVVKKGRLTIAPELVLRRSDVLPERDGEEWNAVERERLAGLEIAKHFGALSALHGRVGGDEAILGRYHDFWW